MSDSETKQFIRFLKDHDAWQAFVKNMKDHTKFTSSHVRYTDVRAQFVSLGCLSGDDMKIYFSKVPSIRALMDSFLFASCKDHKMWWALNSMWSNRVWANAIEKTKKELP